MREISFNGKLSYSDYKKYNAYHFKSKYTAVFIILFLAYCIVFYGILYNLISGFSKFLIIGLASLVLSILTLALLLFARNRKVKSIYNSSPRMKIESTYKTIYKGILIKSDHGTSLIKWKEIIRTVEKDKLIILYTSPVQALIISREYFQNNQDFFDFKNIVKDKIKK
ncbi:MAG: YcxB family protein [Clostridiaceae bacterium]